MIIGIDCDEVLSSTLEQLIKYPEFQGAKRESFYKYSPLTSSEVTLPKQTDMFFWRLFQNPEFWDVKPVKWAYEQLKKIKEAWHTLVVLTWRPQFAADNTKKRVEQEYPQIFSDFLFAAVHTKDEITKAELCEQNGVEMMIEDDPFFVANLSEQGVPCILLDYPWNQEFSLEKHPNVRKIKSRDDFTLEMLAHEKYHYHMFQRQAIFTH